MSEMTTTEVIFYDMAIAMRWKALFSGLKVVAESRYERDRANLILGGSIVGKNETERRAQQDAALMGQQNVRDVIEVALKAIEARVNIAQTVVGAPLIGMSLSEEVVSSVVFGATSNTEQDKALADLSNTLCVHLFYDERFVGGNDYTKDVAASFEDAAWAYAQMLPAFVKLVMSLTEGTIAASTAGDDGEEVPVLRYDSDDDSPF